MSNNWSREEHILAFNLYCKIPFTKINAKYKPVRELAAIIGRSDGSVAMKLANFARLDPTLKARNVSGLTQGAKGEEEVWNEFKDNWQERAYESEKILAKYKGLSVEVSAEVDMDDIDPSIHGKERDAIVKVRVNQEFFRKTVLTSYSTQCCVTGITIPELLVAGHIIPWKDKKEIAVNPTNGLCMNALHDKAFDKGYITVTPDFVIKLSDKLEDKMRKLGDTQFFLPYQNKKITLPNRYLPSKEFLDYHNTEIFNKIA